MNRLDIDMIDTVPRNYSSEHDYTMAAPLARMHTTVSSCLSLAGGSKAHLVSIVGIGIGIGLCTLLYIQ